MEQVKEIINEIKNSTTALPRNADVFKRLKQETSNIIRASLQDWQNAYEDAKYIDNPDRTFLYEIYETIEIDTHVTAVVETIYHGIASMDFTVRNANNESDEELAKLFKTNWFKNWIAISIESIFWGCSGIQYGTLKDNKFTDIKSIPRYNIRPLQNGMVYDQNVEQATIKFDEQPFQSWTSLIFPRMIGDQYQLGKFNKIAKWFILKREVTQFWAIFNELFGHPFRVTKTNVKDSFLRQNAITAMQNMTTASYAVIDNDDEIEFIAPSSGQGYATFKDFIEVADKQMSKGMIGSTMVVDEGSSRAQSETHAKNTNAFIIGYSEIIQGYINDELIPKMALHGIPISTEDMFQFEHIEKLSKLQWTEIIAKLSLNFDVDPDIVSDLTGVKVEEKIIELPTITKEDAENSSIIDKVQNMYKHYIKR